MSDEAYQSGVRKGMALRRALRYCRDVVILSPHRDRYERSMKGFFKYVLFYFLLIEEMDYKGYLFIDVTGIGKLFGLLFDVVWYIYKVVRSDLGFDLIWFVVFNKLIVKVVMCVVKFIGEYIVSAGDEADFLKPLSIHFIFGIE